MFSIATCSHPGPDWSGGCHSLQNYEDAEAALVALTENPAEGAQNWDAEAVRPALEWAAKRYRNGEADARACVDASGEAQPYGVFLEIVCLGLGR